MGGTVRPEASAVILEAVEAGGCAPPVLVGRHPASPGAGQVEMGGKTYMADAKGGLLPIELVKPQHRLQDETVRALLAQAEALAATIAVFKARAFDDVDALQALLEERYKVKVGGAKGNVSLFSYDGLVRILVQVADLLRFGPELQAAKALIDECMVEWVEGARAELRAIVMDAFQTDRQGQLNRGRILGLRRYDISDPRWQRAMEAIADSIQVIGSKRYLRIATRSSLTAPWSEVSLNIATAGE